MSDKTDQKKEFIVVKNGVRASELLTEEEAAQEANQMRRRLNETRTGPESTVQVKRNLVE